MNHTVNHTLLLALMLAPASLIGCDEIQDDDKIVIDVPEVTADVSDLVEAGGCSDVVFTLGAADGTRSLVFWLDTDLAQTAVATGQPQSLTIDLSLEGSLSLHEGTEVVGLECTDTFEDTQVVDVTWEAISGTVELEVLPLEGSDGMPAHGTITLTDAVLSTVGESNLAIESLTWEAGIGWIAAG